MCVVVAAPPACYARFVLIFNTNIYLYICLDTKITNRMSKIATGNIYTCTHIIIYLVPRPHRLQS